MVPEQIEALGKKSFFVNPPTGKIWLSRSRFGGGGVVNEIALEIKLIRRGWKIFRPEAFSLEDQIHSLSTAKYVAGFDGSAFLTALFCKKIYGKYFMFARRNAIPSPVLNALSIKNVPCEQYLFPVTYVEGVGAASRFYMPNINQIATILAELP